MGWVMDGEGWVMDGEGAVERGWRDLRVEVVVLMSQREGGGRGMSCLGVQDGLAAMMETGEV